jgi:hypothetical protein
LRGVAVPHKHKQRSSAPARRWKIGKLWRGKVYAPTTHRYTPIPNHPGDMPEGTLCAILKQAGIEREDFLKD